MKRSQQVAVTTLVAVGAMLAVAQVTDTVPAASAPSAPKPAPAATPVNVNRNVVVLDAAHGGMDSGSRIGDDVLEKDVTLALAMKLQSLLAARGFTVVMTRSGDQNSASSSPAGLTLDARAGTANHAQAAACLLLHATGAGTGVHLYASELDPLEVQPALTPWLTAQAAWVTQSRGLESAAAASLQKADIARISSAASVRPLDSLACPAVIVELAPENDDAESVNDGTYQQHVAEALTAALVSWPQHVQPPLQAPSPGAVRAAAAAAADPGGTP